MRNNRKVTVIKSNSKVDNRKARIAVANRTQDIGPPDILDHVIVKDGKQVIPGIEAGGVSESNKRLNKKGGSRRRIGKNNRGG